MRRLVSILFLLSIYAGAHAQLSFSGSTDPAINIKPAPDSGLEAIYVLSSTGGVAASYHATSATATVQWVRFSAMGGAHSQEVPYSRDGTICTITLGEDDMGYIITDGNRQHCFWVVNYANHAMHIEDARTSAVDSDCSTTAIDVDGSASRINYYTINGIPRELSRDITVSYHTLEGDPESLTYKATDAVKTFASFDRILRVNAPLCATAFTIEGDRFLKEWNREISFTTDSYEPTAIDVMTAATQQSRESDNEMNDSAGESLGGSAPVDISFKAVTTDAVAFREWQISNSPEFDIIDLRYNQDEVDCTFTEQGNSYVRFIAANADASCEWTSEVYTVSIGESRLVCPNAFSPGVSEGINDEWKVSYKSIITFECHIFNQWGIELFSTTEPSKGWDGRHSGKIVPAGVYYYVIKARGADGKEYNLAGDINIIGYKQRNVNTTTPAL